MLFLGINESQLFAKVDYESRLRGAEFLAYPPVVAGGDRATIIHYINNNQLIINNEMVLMDAGKSTHSQFKAFLLPFHFKKVFLINCKELKVKKVLC